MCSLFNWLRHQNNYHNVIAVHWMAFGPETLNHLRESIDGATLLGLQMFSKLSE
jgi:hypothetical protein